MLYFWSLWSNAAYKEVMVYWTVLCKISHFGSLDLGIIKTNICTAKLDSLKIRISFTKHFFLILNICFVSAITLYIPFLLIFLSLLVLSWVCSSCSFLKHFTRSSKLFFLRGRCFTSWYYSLFDILKQHFGKHLSIGIVFHIWTDVSLTFLFFSIKFKKSF